MRRYHDCSAFQGSSGAPLCVTQGNRVLVVGVHIQFQPIEKRWCDKNYDICNCLFVGPTRQQRCGTNVAIPVSTVSPCFNAILLSDAEFKGQAYCIPATDSFIMQH